MTLRRRTSQRRGPPTGRSALLLLALAGCGGPFPQSALQPSSDFAWRLQDLFTGIFWWALIVFVLVEGALLVAVFRFRARPGGPEPRPVHGNTLLEISWTLAPAVILVLIAIPTIRTIWEVDRPTRDPEALVVEAIGHQWWWEFRYPDLGVVTANELHLPVGRTIDVRLTSADVIHSFWFPRIGGKRDVIPGHENHLWFTVDSAGRYLGQCAEFCGMAHALMKMELVAQPPEEFEAWAARQRMPAPTAPPAEARMDEEAEADREAEADQEAPGAARSDSIAGLRAGQTAFMQSGCMACHRIEGTPAAGQTGPDLTHIGSRRTIAAGILENTPENMARWLRDPQAVKPGVLMPNLNLDEERVRKLVAYLESLR